MAFSSCLGFPRIGTKRELKWALEKLWAGTIDRTEFGIRYDTLRIKRWNMQGNLLQIPIFDCSLYDHVLDMIQLFSAIPQRFQELESDKQQQYFAMARGITMQSREVPAMEMSKWFDTNYHYIVPEFDKEQNFSLYPDVLLNELELAQKMSIPARPVILGPISFLLLGKSGASSPLHLLDTLLPCYVQLLSLLSDHKVEWVQFDEPMLAVMPESESLHHAMHAYEFLTKHARGTKILLATYFDSLHDKKTLIYDLPVEGIHIDCVRGSHTVETLAHCSDHKELVSLGVVDGRNVWRNDLEASLSILEPIRDIIGQEKIMVSSSCSLLHTPIDLNVEPSIHTNLRPHLAFALQKLDEIQILEQALTEGRASISEALETNATLNAKKQKLNELNVAAVQNRVEKINDADLHRKTPFEKRYVLQNKSLALPLFPTTTIGSYPQTAELRRTRSQYTKQELSQAEYEDAMRQHIAEVIRFQEKTDIDVLVHGEPERTDMVEYFGELLEGCTTTTFGWVQSYGSRCVKPPIIFGDVYRKNTMTVPWISYAQSLTKRPVKGMLTGPVTILQWSFVRDDIPRSTIAYQIAFAIRDEVADLEKAGIPIIQIDEPALREGLPLRKEEQAGYLTWAVNSFKLASSGVADTTQIHSHMCYSEFNDIIDSIIALDVDVISIESTRSSMELLDAFVQKKYPNAIGPGVYDIHSPVIPTVDMISSHLRQGLTVFSPEQLWINPDCGLKTRKWEEITPSLRHMVSAAKELRKNQS